jgi:fermentation-respiration switch protein FrsA (DUF1100 family)
MKKVFLIIIAILVLLYCLVAVVLYFVQEKIIFHPQPLSQSFHYSLKSIYSEHFLTTNDGKAHINLLWLKAKKTKGVIVYSHGNAGNLERWSEIVTYFTQFGYDVMAYDYRNYGKSTGELSEKNLLDDAQLVYNFAKEHFTETQIICYGRSLGTGIATYLAANNAPQKLILETPYYNLLDIGENYYLGIFPLQLLMKYHLRTDLRITDVRCPIIVFHGTADEVIPYSSAEKLKKLLKPQDKFITVPNGTHNELINYQEFTNSISKEFAP